MSVIKALVGLALGAILTTGPALAQVPRPIPNGGGWLLLDSLPGVQKRVCSARINGPEADTMLLLNNGRVPLLAAGHADWSGHLGPADVQLSIDDDPPRALKMQMFNNLVLVLLSDDRLIERLRRAKTLTWALPFGHFRAEVDGLGVALDAVGACGAAEEGKPVQPPST
jgi:hypothetical protein